MLLEDAGSRSLLDLFREQGDEAATGIAAELLARLLSPSGLPIPADLQPLRERFAALFRRASLDPVNGASSLYREAAELAADLFSRSHGALPLHGDLHHENIVQGSRGWLAIDPKGLWGDPAFDAANLFYNPLGEDRLCRNPRRIAATATVLAHTLGQSERHIAEYAFAYGCLSAAWHAADANIPEEERTLAIARAIRAVIAQS